MCARQKALMFVEKCTKWKVETTGVFEAKICTGKATHSRANKGARERGGAVMIGSYDKIEISLVWWGCLFDAVESIQYVVAVCPFCLCPHDRIINHNLQLRSVVCTENSARPRDISIHTAIEFHSVVRLRVGFRMLRLSPHARARAHVLQIRTHTVALL